MYTVVNHLIFRDPVDPAVFAEFSTLADDLRATDGFEAAHVVQTSEREVVLLIVGRDAEALDRIATEAGSPWLMRTVVPRLAGAPDQQLGPVIASTSYGAA
ncbi:MAG: hypothetical protein WAV00_21575 [Nocardioides sp.]